MRPSVRVSTTGTSAAAVRPPVAFAATWTTYAPSGRPRPSKTMVRAAARRHCFGSSSATVVPLASTTVTSTFAFAPSVYEIVVVSACPSPLGVIAAGSARAPVTASAPAAVATRTPSAAVAPGVSIRHCVPAGTGAAGSQVQSTAAPLPSPRPSSPPLASVTVTVHGRAAESLAVKRVPPDSSVATVGAYTFGSPSVATRCAIVGMRS